MRQAFRIFFGSEGTNPILVLACLLLASVAEAIGLSTLLPVVTSLAGGSGSASRGVAEFVEGLIAGSGLSLNFGVLIVVVVSLLLLKSALTFVALAYAGISGARVSIALRRRLVAAVFDARWEYFTSQHTGTFANAAVNDAGRAGDAYWLAANVMARLIQVVGYSAVALLINWRLALLGLAAGLIISATLGNLISSAKRAGYRQTDRTRRLSVHLVDLLANIKPLKASHRYGHLLENIASVLKKLKRSLVARELSKVGLSQGNEALAAILAGAGLYFAHAFLNIPLPELLVSALIFFQIMAIIFSLQKHMQAAVNLESAYIRTRELIAEAERNREINKSKLRPEIGRGCRFDTVSFAHGETEVVSNVSFEVPSNRITVLSGPSGSGKTTIVDLLIGLHQPDSGRILVGGTPLGEIDLFAWRKMIGYVPQELNLFHASIRENIALDDPGISDDEVLSALALAGAGDFVATLPQGLDTDVGEMGGKLSGGQRQRISLARALVTKPQVLILDEVTSALDPATEAEIVAKIESLRGSYTIIVITHRPAWTTIADKLYRVSHGKVTAESRSVRRTPSKRK